MDTRPPHAAGRFYPGDRATLAKEVRKMLVPALNPAVAACGVMVPHAGYVYSGPVAGQTFASITPPSVAILLGPNHGGTGPAASLWNSGKWSTPLGDAGVDSALALALSRVCGKLVPDRQPHLAEHSLEVQVPFLLAINPGIKIVPILFRMANLEMLREVGVAIASVIASISPRPLLVASTDMNHFEPHDATIEKDGPVLDAIMALDPEGMWKAVQKGRVSMCGVQPVAVMLEAVRRLGGKKARLIGHTTSGPVSGDFERTVGYAGIVFD